MLVPGMLIKIMLLDDKNLFISRVADCNSREVMIEEPVKVETGKTGLFHRKDILDLNFIGKDGALYKCRSKILMKKRDNIPLLVLEYPNQQNINRIQRREFVRVSDSMAVSLYFDNAIDRGTLVDISAGGVAIKIEKDATYSIGDVVTIEFLLPDKTYGFMRLECAVKRLIVLNGCSKMCLQFINITETERQLLTKYVFSKQVLSRSQNSVEQQREGGLIC